MAGHSLHQWAPLYYDHNTMRLKKEALYETLTFPGSELISKLPKSHGKFFHYH